MLWTEQSAPHIERIYADDSLWTTALDKAKKFWVVAILPELLGKWFTRPPTNAPQTEDAVDAAGEPLLCYCKTAEKGDHMVGCDNEKCPFKWFHLKCLNLKNLPKSKQWYCPTCRKEKKGKK